MNAKTNKRSKPSQKGRISVVSGENVNLSANISLWEVIFSSVHYNFIGNFWFYFYGFLLGFSILQIGIILALSLFCYGVIPLIVQMADMTTDKKKLNVGARLISIIALAMLPIAGQTDFQPLCLTLFTLIFLIHAMAQIVSMVVWCNTIASSIHEAVKKRFLTRRYIIGYATNISGTLAACLYLAKYPTIDGAHTNLLFASIFGLLAVITMILQPREKYQSLASTTIKNITDNLYSRKFRNSTLFTALFSCASAVKMNVSVGYLIQNSSIGLVGIGILLALYFLGAFLFMQGWQKLASHFGKKNVMLFSGLLSGIIVPILVILSVKGGHFYLHLAFFIEGMCVGATNSLLIALPLQIANRNQSTALSNGLRAVIGVSGGIGTLLAVLILDTQLGFAIPNAFGIDLSPFATLHIIGGLIMLLSTIFLIRQFEPPKGTFKQMLPYIIPTLFFFWRKPNFAEETDKSDHK